MHFKFELKTISPPKIWTINLCIQSLVTVVDMNFSVLLHHQPYEYNWKAQYDPLNINKLLHKYNTKHLICSTLELQHYVYLKIKNHSTFIRQHYA